MLNKDEKLINVGPIILFHLNPLHLALGLALVFNTLGLRMNGCSFLEIWKENVKSEPLDLTLKLLEVLDHIDEEHIFYFFP